MKEYLLKRIEEIQLAINQSAANHNALMGRLAECQEQLQHLTREIPLSDDSI